MRITLITLLVLAAPRAVLACPVCFGQNDSPMTSGAKMAVIFMLVIVGLVLSAFASFFIYLMRRARMAGGDMAPAHAGPAGAGHYVRDAARDGPDAQEGTARC